MAKTSLPPGFRFHPTDVELVMYYLKRKVMGKQRFNVISEVDIYKFAPWDLPDKSCLQNRDLKWYFFCPRARKYVSGGRLNRATEYGYWKTTGKDRPILYNNDTVGMIKTLIFHKGRAPRGDRTNWVMHEYRLEDNDLASKGVFQDTYVLCMIFQKDGRGPRNGAQYGAPFKEEDWSDEEVDCVEADPSTGLYKPETVLPVNQNNPMLTSSCILGSIYSGSASEAGPSETVVSAEKAFPLDPNDDIVVMGEVSEVPEDDDDILAMLAFFTEDGTLVSNENDNIEKPDNLNHGINVEDANDIYNNLGDLDNWAEQCQNRFDFSRGCYSEYSLEQMISGEGVSFLELTDLDTPLNCPTESGGSEFVPVDGLYTNYNSYNKPEQLGYPVNSSAAQQVSGFSQPPLLPVEPYGFQGQFNVSEGELLK